MMTPGDWMNVGQLVAEDMAANGGRISPETRAHLSVVLAAAPREQLEETRKALLAGVDAVEQVLSFLEEHMATRATDPAPGGVPPVPESTYGLDDFADFESSVPPSSAPPPEPSAVDDSGHGAVPSRAQQLRRQRR